MDTKTLAGELKSLKRIVRHYYDKKRVTDVWQCILRSRRSELPNLCVVAEMIFSIGVSNGFVESCFSFLTAMLSDRRLSMCHETMSDLLLIRANHLTWTDRERDEIINNAVKNFMTTRRKLKMNKSCEASQPPAKIAAISLPTLSSEPTIDTKDNSYCNDTALTSDADDDLTSEHSHCDQSSSSNDDFYDDGESDLDDAEARIQKEIGHSDTDTDYD